MKAKLFIKKFWYYILAGVMIASAVVISFLPFSDRYALAAPIYPSVSANGEINTEAAYNDALIDFSYNTAKAVLTDSNENQIYSPLSLYYALSMLAECASGETLNQILNVLQQTDLAYNREQSKILYNDYYINKSNSEKTTIANSVWLNSAYNGYSYKQETLGVLAENYYASTYGVDFSKAAAAREMAKWIRNNTGNLLGNESDFDTDGSTALMLINAIYFKQKWANEFEERDTRSDTFYLADGNTVTTDFMYQTLENTITDTDTYLAASLDYKIGGQKMTLVLPDEGISAYDILADTDEIKNILSNDASYSAQIKYSMPKFDYKSDMDLVETLNSLGMSKAFTNDAEFDKMFTFGAKVDKVFQKATIKVDEQGSEAAAYTGIQIEPTCALVENTIVEFKLNRPFIFIISNESDIPLFIGVVNNPSL